MPESHINRTKAVISMTTQQNSRDDAGSVTRWVTLANTAESALNTGVKDVV